jgi:hypothetical protein
VKSPRGLTTYQVEILRHLQGADEAEPLDFDQLLGALSWAPSKESAQFSLRALTAKGLIAKSELLRLRRGRKRVCYLLTKEGAIALDPRLAAPASPPTVPEIATAKPKPKATPPKAAVSVPGGKVSTDLEELLSSLSTEAIEEEIATPITLFSIED